MVQLCRCEGRAHRTAVPGPQQPLCSTAWQYPQPWQNCTQWDSGFPHGEQNTWTQKGGGEDKGWHFLHFAKLPFTHFYQFMHWPWLCLLHTMQSWRALDGKVAGLAFLWFNIQVSNFQDQAFSWRHLDFLFTKSVVWICPRIVLGCQCPTVLIHHCVPTSIPCGSRTERKRNRRYSSMKKNVRKYRLHNHVSCTFPF